MAAFAPSSPLAFYPGCFPVHLFNPLSIIPQSFNHKPSPCGSGEAHGRPPGPLIVWILFVASTGGFLYIGITTLEDIVSSVESMIQACLNLAKKLTLSMYPFYLREFA